MSYNQLERVKITSTCKLKNWSFKQAFDEKIACVLHCNFVSKKRKISDGFSRKKT